VFDGDRIRTAPSYGLANYLGRAMSSENPEQSLQLATSAASSNLNENSTNAAPDVAADSKPTAPPPPHPMAAVAADFLRRIHDVELAAQVAIPAIGEYLDEESEKLKAKLQPYIVDEDKNRFKIRLPESAREISTIKAALKDMTRIQTSKIGQTLSRSLFIGSFSEFDAFIGELLKLIYAGKAELYKDIKREISFADLVNSDSVEAMKREMLEKEIDTFRRESYVEQFNILERKFSISLIKFPEWPIFVEMSQRRNLMTHNDGIVSNQYLLVCDKAGYKFKKRPSIGEKLDVSPRYYFSTGRILSTVAFMLVYTLWRKIFPGESSQANDALTVAIYDILSDRKWGLATRLAEFSLTKEMTRDADDLGVKVRCVNHAIGLYRTGQKDACASFLASKDWSACLPDFKLAVAVLSDNVAEACKIILDIGKESTLVRQSVYHEWPLFIDFKELPEFLEVYEKVYGAPFNSTQGEELSVSTSAPAPTFDAEPSPQRLGELLSDIPMSSNAPSKAHGSGQTDSDATLINTLKRGVDSATPVKLHTVPPSDDNDGK
jgi:hypothetical protein